MLGQSINIFVSYSHADAALVGPVVKLLGVNKSLVFQDVDGIQPAESEAAAPCRARRIARFLFSQREYLCVWDRRPRVARRLDAEFFRRLSS